MNIDERQSSVGCTPARTPAEAELARAPSHPCPFMVNRRCLVLPTRSSPSPDTEIRAPRRGEWSAAVAGFFVMVVALASGCQRAQPVGWQGWIEGEFVYVASPLAGRLEQLAVQKGARVEAGSPLFTLERTAELATQREASSRLSQSQARLEDLKKGQRPSELATLQARLARARSIAELSASELARMTRLRTENVVADVDLDRARLNHEANTRSVTELESQLATAELGGRTDAIVAAEAEQAAAKATLERADWSVAQKSQAAPAAGLVFDRLFQAGEFVPAGTPVISLLPPENLKIRFFVSEADFASFKSGDPVLVSITGRPEPLAARITYLATRPEYTPPVLYNRENRAKLVFMIEASPIDSAAARDLHPGQPVDVRR